MQRGRSPGSAHLCLQEAHMSREHICAPFGQICSDCICTVLGTRGKQEHSSKPRLSVSIRKS